MSRLRRSYLGFALLGCLAVGLAGCGTSRSGATSGGGGHAKVTRGKEAPPTAPKPLPEKLDKATKALLTEAYSWQGVPYLYGGNDRNGVDCSGFVLQVYLRSAGIGLPRVSREQYAYCTPLKRDELKPGDLVFFATTAGKPDVVSHVGIYVGSGRMIHSSSSKGVIESDLTSNYYATHYLGGGRVERFEAMRTAAAGPQPDALASNQSAEKPKKEPKPKKESSKSDKEAAPAPTRSVKDRHEGRQPLTRRGARASAAGQPSAPDSEAATGADDYRSRVLNSLDD